MDKERVIYYYNAEEKPIFSIEGNHIYPVLKDGETYKDFIAKYKVEIPEKVEGRYHDDTKEVEFDGETITLSGVILNQETGTITLDMQCLETMLCIIPPRNLTFINRYQENSPKTASK